MKLSPHAPCPCGREAELARCCGPYLRGRPAAPEALMRARYTAFALGKVRFIIDTTHPQAPHAQADVAAWRAELAAYCRRFRFEGLTVHQSSVDEDAGRAFVSFTVRMRDGDDRLGFSETSLFLRDDGRWRYHSGELRPA